MRSFLPGLLLVLTTTLGACSLLEDYDKYTEGGAGGAGAGGGKGGAAGGAGKGGSAQGGTAGAGGEAGGVGGVGGVGGAGGAGGEGGSGAGQGGASGGGVGGSSGAGGEGPAKEGAPCATAGKQACLGPAQRGVLRCEAGAWKRIADCTMNERCDNAAGPTEGKCAAVAPGCADRQPDDIACDGPKRVRCGPDLVTSKLLDTCLSAELCAKSAGEKCASCVPGEFACAGDKLLRCNDQGGVDDIDTCDSAALCDVSDKTKGACKPPACGKGEVKCEGDLLRVCLADLTGFDAGTPCMAGLCDSTGKQCDTCVAGATSCADGATRRVCSADGQKLDETPCPADTPHCIGAGNCVACTDDKQCPASQNECTEPRCVNNACTFANKPAGAAATSQTAGDCKKNVCDGNGKITSEDDKSDLPADDGNPCTQESCLGGAPTTTPLADGTKCPLGACLGNVCNPNPSCTDQATDYICGKDLNANCCLAKSVPGGTFARGYDMSSDMTPVAGRQSTPGATATLAPFKLESFEVSVRRFRKFVNAFPASLPAPGDGALGGFPGWQASWKSSMPTSVTQFKSALAACPDTTWSEVDGGPNEGRPINCVTWYEAVAFCLWDGGRLASEAQWNFAAAGGDQQRAYPWSSPAGSTSINETFASYYVDNNKFCYGDKVAGCSAADIVQTGSFLPGAGRWGHYDMAGNVSEWVLDTLIDINTYPVDADKKCDDCVGHIEPGQAVTRGGQFDSQAPLVRTAYRFGLARTQRLKGVGFRCTRP